MSVTGQDIFVKENYMLSRERVTAFTQLTTENDISFKPEFIFKGKGKRVKLNPPEGARSMGAQRLLPIGSYARDNFPSPKAQHEHVYSQRLCDLCS